MQNRSSLKSIIKIALILIGCNFHYSLLAFQQVHALGYIESKVISSRECKTTSYHPEDSPILKLFLNNRCNQKYLSCDEIKKLKIQSIPDSILYLISLGDCQMFSPKQNTSDAYNQYLSAYKLAKGKKSTVLIAEALKKLIAFNLFAGTASQETDKLVQEHQLYAYDALEKHQNQFYQLRLNTSLTEIEEKTTSKKIKSWQQLISDIADQSPKIESEIRSYFGVYLEACKKIDEAEEQLLKSIIAAEKVNHDFHQDARFSSFANIGYMKLAEEENNLALNYFKKAQRIESRMTSDRNSSLLYEWISTCYYNLDKSDSAFHYLKLASEKRKLADEKEHSSKIQEIQSKYDNEKLSNDLLIVKSEKQKSNYLAAIFVGISLISLLIYRNQKIKTAATERELENVTLKSSLDQQKALEQERARIAGEMHDDLGGGLTTIKFLSQKVLKNIPSQQDKVKLEKIVSHSKNLVGNMSEIIWAMNAGFDNLESLIGYTRRFCSEYLEDHELDFKFRIEGDISNIALSGERRRSIFLVIKESLHNIVKHAEATQAEITFTINGYIEIKIKDNGKGFLKDESKLGNGLNNMKSRIIKINGTFNIESTDGTLILIHLPI